MNIIRLTIDNIELAESLVNKFKEVSSSRKPLEAFFNNPNNILIGAFDDDKPVGVLIGYRLDRTDTTRPMFYVHDLTVDKEYRRRGIATSMINTLKEEAIIPHEFINDIEEGAREATLSGVLSGYPIVDIKITLIDGLYREGTSSSLGYKIASSTALREGCQKAQPILLEPIMLIEIIAPNDFVGEVIGDLNARGGKVEMINAKGTISVIDAHAPLKRMFGYTTSLRSVTQGRGSFSMHFSHYDKTSE